ncbi:MAG: hypothetical protein U0L55_07245, partial [Acutalibacteraceae bacterium]|nr:hypothetical protein [Acutalibacteraceae bacterium]
MATKSTNKGKTKKSTKKRSATATEIKNQRERAAEPQGGGQIKAILLFALAILILFLVIIEGQSLWNALHKFLFGVFGICVYTLPIFLGIVAVFSAMDKFSSTVTIRTVESLLMVTFIGAAIDVFSSHPQNQTFGEH